MSQNTLLLLLVLGLALFNLYILLRLNNVVGSGPTSFQLDHDGQPFPYRFRPFKVPRELWHSESLMFELANEKYNYPILFWNRTQYLSEIHRPEVPSEEKYCTNIAVVRFENVTFNNRIWQRVDWTNSKDQSFDGYLLNAYYDNRHDEYEVVVLIATKKRGYLEDMKLR